MCDAKVIDGNIVLNDEDEMETHFVAPNDTNVTVNIVPKKNSAKRKDGKVISKSLRMKWKNKTMRKKDDKVISKSRRQNDFVAPNDTNVTVNIVPKKNSAKGKDGKVISKNLRKKWKNKTMRKKDDKVIYKSRRQKTSAKKLRRKERQEKKIADAVAAELKGLSP